MPFAIGTFSEEDNLYFCYEITGQITNATDAYESTANLSVLLRDDEGAHCSRLHRVGIPHKGAAHEDFWSHCTPRPDHAKVEVYAQPA
ncbi:MAG: hypothetical protein V8T51_03050 [Senegalimassilia faecalis]